MAHAARPKIIAVILGGVLQGVFTDSPVDFTLSDWDQDHTEEDAGHYLFTPVIDGQEMAVFVTNGFPTNDVSELPRAEQLALEAAGLDSNWAK